MSGTLVLDCEGLSKLVRRTPELTEWLAAAEAEDIRVVTSSVTLVEARDPKTNQARFDYAASSDSARQREYPWLAGTDRTVCSAVPWPHPRIPPHRPPLPWRQLPSPGSEAACQPR